MQMMSVSHYKLVTRCIFTYQKLVVAYENSSFNPQINFKY